MSFQHRTSTTSRRETTALGFLLVLVGIRIYPFIVFDYVHFNSDQAVFGLMSLDLSQLEAFPLFMYGQKYFLAVDSWLAAPFIWVMGPSILALNIPLVFWNVTAVLCLFWLLRKELALRPLGAGFVVLLIALPSPIYSLAFMSISAGSIQPVLYVLLLWLIKDRPVWFGLLAALAYAHRELVSAGMLAALIVVFINRESWRSFFVHVAKVVILFLATKWSLHALASYSAYYVGNEAWVTIGSFKRIGENLPYTAIFSASLMNLMAVSLKDFGLPTAIRMHWPVWIWGLSTILAFILFRTMFLVKQFGLLSLARDKPFPIYLILVGLGSVAAFSAKSGFMDFPMIRYLALFIFLPIGLLSLFIALENRKGFAVLGYVFVAMLGIQNLSTIIHYNSDLHSRKPVDRYGELAQKLLQRDYRYGTAPYWDAYRLTYRSGEKLKVASNDHVRIGEYKVLYEANRDQAFKLQKLPCTGEREQRIDGWYVCGPDDDLE